MTFRQLVNRLAAFRITCASCGTRLRVGPIAYVWMALHAVLAIGIVALHRYLTEQGIIRSPGALLVYMLLVVAVIFATSMVIPWYLLPNAYREEKSAERV